MYARKWRCICPHRNKEGFLDYLKETGLKESSETPGYMGAQVMVRDVEDATEITLITYWDRLESIRRFAGDNIEMARLYPEDVAYEIKADLHATHYEVLHHEFLDSWIQKNL